MKAFLLPKHLICKVDGYSVSNVNNLSRECEQTVDDIFDKFKTESPDDMIEEFKVNVYLTLMGLHEESNIVHVVNDMVDISYDSIEGFFTYLNECSGTVCGKLSDTVPNGKYYFCYGNSVPEQGFEVDMNEYGKRLLKEFQSKESEQLVFWSRQFRKYNTTS